MCERDCFYQHVVQGDLDPVDCLTAELVDKAPYPEMHLPGAGVAGHCISKDPRLLIANAGSGFEPRLIPTVRAISDKMPLLLPDLVVLGERVAQ